MSFVAVGPEPSRVKCPSCHNDIITSVKMEATSKTHIAALIMCLFLCWPCVCVPYCMDSCRAKNHYCPSCNSFLGSYNS